MKRTPLNNDELDQISGGMSIRDSMILSGVQPDEEFTCVSSKEITVGGQTYGKGETFTCTGTELLDEISGQITLHSKFEYTRIDSEN